MPAEIGFRPLVAADYPLLRRWLEAPHVRDWWGDPDEELGHVRAMVEGRDTTRPFVILVDGAPAGYIQVWFIGHHQNAEWIATHPWLAELPADAVGVDLSLGEPGLLSQGIGSAGHNFLQGLARLLHPFGRPINQAVVKSDNQGPAIGLKYFVQTSGGHYHSF